MKKGLFWLVLIALALYFGVCVNLYRNQRNIMYNVIDISNTPENFPITRNYKTIVVQTSDHIQLEGWYMPSENGKVIVAFHGNGQNIGSTFGGVSRLTEYGYGLLMVEYRGYAGHEGEFTEDGAYRDARAFIKWLHKKQNIPFQDMILYGESLGSAVAFKMASELDVAAVVALGSFISIAQVAQDLYWFMPVRQVLHDQYDVEKIIGNINEPKLFIHGSNDDIIPISYAKDLYAITSEPKAFLEIKSAGHNDLCDDATAKKIALFLEEHVQEKSD